MSAESMDMVVSEPVCDGFLAIDGLGEHVPFSHASISKGFGSTATVSVELPKPIQPEAEKAIHKWIASANKTEKISLLDGNEKLLNELFDPSSCTLNSSGDQVQLIVTSRIQ